MLTRSTWTLAVDESVSIPQTYGMEMVKLLHHNMGMELGREEVPTTTCSGLLGRYTSSQDFVTFHPDEFYQIQITGLKEHSSKAIAHLDLSDRLEFLGASFKIINRDDYTTSYEDLYHTWVASEPEPEHHIQLQFLTPTAFSQGRTQLPLPVPALLFRSWLDRWNEFAPVYLGGDELVGYFGEYVALPRHRIQTRSHPVYKGRVSGFVGDVTLYVPTRTEPLLANVANLLATYAQFSGTGIKTRLGMGQTRLVVTQLPD